MHKDCRQHFIGHQRCLQELQPLLTFCHEINISTQHYLLAKSIKKLYYQKREKVCTQNYITLYYIYSGAFGFSNLWLNRLIEILKTNALTCKHINNNLLT